jgi:dTDP-4-amino-4,6-dideoxygalactose transaminase
MPVHYAGFAGDLDRLYDFANAYDLRVIEDAAHAFGSSVHGKFVGASGDIGCFSFDPIKNITSGEGGAVVSADPKVYESVRRMSNLGIDPNGGDFNGKVTGPGWRYHMPDMMAAIGRVQLARFDQELKPKRQAVTTSYRKALADISNIELLESSSASVAHINVIKVLGGRRDAVRDALALAGFDSRVHYRPNHLQPIFSDGAKRPVAEELYCQLITLPSSLEVEESHCLEISQIIRSVVG